ncbi:MAG: phosphotransferase family protein [Anaerolineae bacterium]|jgi:aminoglycoside phosphotransferase (APT) family kinase protein|nr:phosphotransferase family protein [Anaerolineae bacterium]
MMTNPIQSKLEAYLSAQTNSPVTITDIMPLAGGASRESWSLTAHIHNTPQKLVLRKDYPTQMNEAALTRSQEYHLMARAYETGVKVAKMRFICDDPDVLGLPFFLMDFVEGMSVGKQVMKAPELDHARAVLPEQLAEQLALIHKMRVDDLDFLPRPPQGISPTHAVVDEVYAVLDRLGVKSPTFEFCLRWALNHAPQADRITFVHGDFRIGNLLVNPNGLSAVIDWEFGHIGDPREELGYICMRDWRFGNDHLHMGGLAPRERFIRAYEGFSGVTIDRSAVDWWEMMGNIRWGVICMAQAQRHLSGADPSVELASLGRRSAEMQYEVLRLIERIGL